jgi:hypothetical protein
MEYTQAIGDGGSGELFIVHSVGMGYLKIKVILKQ